MTTGLYRTFVIVKHTFREAVVQPIYSLLLGLGAGILLVFAVLPFFTLGEDTVMYVSVGLDVILLLVLIATLFATSKSIFDEIEDRTMLTLMSKPVRKWEVLAGKYVGIILSALLGVAILGGILGICTYLRIPRDYTLSTATIDDRELAQLHDYHMTHLLGLLPSLLMLWVEICVLAAVSVALSTRFSLVVNLPTVILVYFAGNLGRFLYPIFGPDSPLKGQTPIVKGLAYVIGVLRPSLELFDLKPLTVYGKLAVGQFAANPNSWQLLTIWHFVAMSSAYGLAYILFALSIGMWLFQRRELGGAEG